MYTNEQMEINIFSAINKLALKHDTNPVFLHDLAQNVRNLEDDM